MNHTGEASESHSADRESMPSAMGSVRLWMHHAATGDLQPVLAHLLDERVGEINLVARLGVAEIVRDCYE